jgi:hypothetical protein
MLIKLADFTRHQRRKGSQPYLIGRAGDFYLMLVDRHKPEPGGPVATLFIGPAPNRGDDTIKVTDNKPLPPVWDAKQSKWIGPASPDYPGFFDDTEAAVADLKGL